MSRYAVLQTYPELRDMPTLQKNAVIRHLLPYVQSNAVDSLSLLPMNQQREALEDLFFELAVAKARCDLKEPRLQEDFSQSSMEEVVADVRKVFAEELAAAPADQREYLVNYISKHIFPYRFSDIYPDPRIQAISKRTLMSSALTGAPGAEKHPAAVQPVAMQPASISTPAAGTSTEQEPLNSTMQLTVSRMGSFPNVPRDEPNQATQETSSVEETPPTKPQTSPYFWEAGFYAEEGLALRLTLFVVGVLAIGLILYVVFRAIAASRQPPMYEQSAVPVPQAPVQGVQIDEYF